MRKYRGSPCRPEQVAPGGRGGGVCRASRIINTIEMFSLQSVLTGGEMADYFKVMTFIRHITAAL